MPFGLDAVDLKRVRAERMELPHQRADQQGHHDQHGPVAAEVANQSRHHEPQIKDRIWFHIETEKVTMAPSVTTKARVIVTERST